MTLESEEQARAESIVGRMMAHDAFSRWLGIELIAIRPRACTLRMTVRPDMVNGFGVSHGGITYSLADSALAFACNSDADEHVAMSIENTIAYPVAVNVGDELVAVAEEESASGRLGFYRVMVANQDGTCVALFTGTVYRTKRKHHTDTTHEH
jgi:acyl-CoA thioesterase